MTIEYIAGFFDGEGTIQITGNRVRLSLPQTHEGVLIQVKDYFETGTVSKLKKRQDHWKEAWCYYVTSNEACLEVLTRLYPHLIVKQDKAIEALKVLVEYVKGKEQWSKKVDQAVLLVKEGKSYREAQRETGVSRQTICNILKTVH